MPKNLVLLSELSEKPPGEFAVAAYETIVGRRPTPRESDEVIASLLRGDSPTWILGTLRYGAEGNRHAIDIPGLRVRYLAQRTWRIPAIGPVLQWIASLVRLPASLRYLRAVRQRNAVIDEQARRSIAASFEDVQRRHDEMASARAKDAALTATLEGTIRESLASIAALHGQHASLAASLAEARAHLEGVQAAAHSLASSVAELRKRHDDTQERVESTTASVAELRTRHEDALARAESVTATIAELQAAFDDTRKREEAVRDSLAALQARVVEQAGHVASDRTRMGDVEREVHGVTTRMGHVEGGIHDATARIGGVETGIDGVVAQIDGLAASLARMQPRLESLFPANLGDTLEINGSPLTVVARERRGLPADTAFASLSPHERYALFESVFYESAAVAEKQRIYLGFLNRPLSQRFRFLDLGCGRGEFLRILRDDGIDALGVDVNAASLATARDSGLRVFEQDLLAFLESDRGIYSGASLLQVAEHLTAAQLDRLLELLLPRLAPGAVFILETPNPLSPFALGVFYTDATHVVPLPPERMRFELEAAGFENTRTLFQGRIPGDQFAGPDPRAWYMDYAVIASRGTS